jgi:hypothetical protein
MKYRSPSSLLHKSRYGGDSEDSQRQNDSVYTPVLTQKNVTREGDAAAAE